MRAAKPASRQWSVGPAAAWMSAPVELPTQLAAVTTQPTTDQGRAAGGSET